MAEMMGLGESVTGGEGMAGKKSFMVDVVGDGTFIVNPEPVEGQESAPITAKSIDELIAILGGESAPEVEEPEMVEEPAPDAAMTPAAPAPKKKQNPMEMFVNPNRA
jgi:hypothetical protein